MLHSNSMSIHLWSIVYFFTMCSSIMDWTVTYTQDQVSFHNYKLHSFGHVCNTSRCNANKNRSIAVEFPATKEATEPSDNAVSISHSCGINTNTSLLFCYEFYQWPTFSMTKVGYGTTYVFRCDETWSVCLSFNYQDNDLASAPCSSQQKGDC